MLYTKYQSSRLCGFGEEDFQRFFFRLPWQPEFFMEWNHLNNLCRAPSKEHLCKVWSLSHQWFWSRRCLSKLLTHDGRWTTDDGRRRTIDTARSQKLTLAVCARWAKNDCNRGKHESKVRYPKFFKYLICTEFARLQKSIPISNKVLLSQLYHCSLTFSVW